jgi:hypothetical protein
VKAHSDRLYARRHTNSANQPAYIFRLPYYLCINDEYALVEEAQIHLW